MILSPCPRCKETPTEASIKPLWASYVAVECKCGKLGSVAKTNADAAAKWNAMAERTE